MADYTAQIESIYLAYYGRPADVTGLLKVIWLASSIALVPQQRQPRCTRQAATSQRSMQSTLLCLTAQLMLKA